VAKDDKGEHRSNGEHRGQGTISSGMAQARGLMDSASANLGLDGKSAITSAAIIGIGALLEPELLGGMLLGAGAVYASRKLPQITQFFGPLFRTAVRAGYAAAASASELIAEASEQVQDTIAEARVEYARRETGHSGPQS
jgi:hypothetical protein